MKSLNSNLIVEEVEQFVEVDSEENLKNKSKVLKTVDLYDSKEF